MEKTYWTLFALTISGFVMSIALIVIVMIISFKGLIRNGYCIGVTTTLLFVVMLSVYHLIPCIKDFSLVISGEFLEDNSTVVEFTYVHKDLDGNGNIQNSNPKFYMESTGEYVVFKISDVEIGKRYRIRYYPNTKICEIINCIE